MREASPAEELQIVKYGNYINNLAKKIKITLC